MKLCTCAGLTSKSHERRLELPYLLAKPQRYMNAPWSNRSAREHADHHGVWLVPIGLEGEDTERLSGMESFENDGQDATIAGHRSWEVLIARHIWFVSETIGFRISSGSQWKTEERTFVHIGRCRGISCILMDQFWTPLLTELHYFDPRTPLLRIDSKLRAKTCLSVLDFP